jgi:S-(hydroxymethyl)glutathione dehydrogenase/alcohol dehydrogenase
MPTELVGDAMTASLAESTGGSTELLESSVLRSHRSTCCRRDWSNLRWLLNAVSERTIDLMEALMRAAVVEGAGVPLRVWDDIDVGHPGAGEVRVRLGASGICGSDLSTLDALAAGHLPPAWHPPCVMGHEASGVVAEVGEGVTSVAEGDHVIIALLAPCGACPECTSGHSNLCRDWAARLQRSMSGGGDNPPFSSSAGPVARIQHAAHAEEVIVPQSAAVRIAPDVPLDVAALLGCGVMTGVGAVLNTAQVTPGSSVAVLGCGGVGLSAVQGARIAGAAAIVAVDPFPERRAHSIKFGATHAVAPDELADLAHDEFDGTGFDYVIEASGHAFDHALAQTRRGGTLVLVGLHGGTGALSLSDLTMTERCIRGSFYGSAHVHRDLPRLLDLWRYGRLDLDGLITTRIDLSEINDAFAAMRDGEGIRHVVVFS